MNNTSSKMCVINAKTTKDVEILEINKNTSEIKDEIDNQTN